VFDKDTGIGWKEDDSPFRNELWMSEETLRQLITPDLSLDDVAKLAGGRAPGESLQELLKAPAELDPRVARANGLVKIGGDASLYDSEEILQIIEEVLERRLKPLAAQALLRLAGQGKGR